MSETMQICIARRTRKPERAEIRRDPPSFADGTLTAAHRRVASHRPSSLPAGADRSGPQRQAQRRLPAGAARDHVWRHVRPHRHELLKYARIAEEQPLYVTPAYSHNQPTGADPTDFANSDLPALSVVPDCGMRGVASRRPFQVRDSGTLWLTVEDNTR
ncbi:hypothetical protein EMIHUDRAFT_432846 [Emiliania huxleyi CCMP1516]|uniref:Uncharacterized protein n=2 Tax=Emiliania huxleyi TaxID=2903 RepID=A0A0D3IDV2_EMIH1|nr:hypothetical protein EMIHUDRAFT_432846 [Emiliania huxleyi CCMP1516]EOD09437.1 hypothetical protein EMIHUDRAFT_432846 [Emiliania huxleyi CCMP1516]|eukprot:XP_005761866.1 hypothetical protein EMIHUDRAFT_432846 [Emiliania huxleyi CCMP1516]